MRHAVISNFYVFPYAHVWSGRTKKQSGIQSQMGLKEEFEEYAEKAKTLPESTTNESKLILYGLYKQGTIGPVNTGRPGIFNLRDRAKWDAW
ncbi:Acyl-CoA-binding protein [Quillaja saponaria]|uniref:Acyl-CoA-binding protein n=1 Tax=Quillaja saponaria TaxID=32244 RepID=A0AAD7P6U6_QUISA|nr:Acyl-CoA-binding protein [Quillaja saponaria]